MRQLDGSAVELLEHTVRVHPTLLRKDSAITLHLIVAGSPTAVATSAVTNVQLRRFAEAHARERRTVNTVLGFITYPLAVVMVLRASVALTPLGSGLFPGGVGRSSAIIGLGVLCVAALSLALFVNGPLGAALHGAAGRAAARYRKQSGATDAGH